MMRILLTLWRARRGAQTLEAAMALPLLLTLMLGTIEVGRFAYERQTLQTAAEDTARRAMLNTAATTDNLKSFLRERIVSDAEITIDDVVVGSVTFKQIIARAPFNFTAIIPIGPIQIEGRARLPLPAS
jgi:Flp pilus assembly protein TadG